jgi:hypothetical protein
MTNYSWGWISPSGTQPQGLMSDGWLQINVVVPEGNPKKHKRGRRPKVRQDFEAALREDEELMIILWGFLHVN